MSTQVTQDLIKDRGWTYVPEHDGLTGKDMMIETVIPECWVHEEYGIAWDAADVLSYIDAETELEIERDLS